MIEYSTSLDEVNWLVFGLLFIGAAAVDALFALYTYKVVAGKAFQAASITTALYFIEVFGVLNFIQNIWYVFPLAAGAFVGTYYTVQRENRKNKKV